uniref:Uncharacterized protein n=1 Tax=Ditylenchus dipsaci TaxID=166011 RepID=A0A915CX77_9BILA
MWLPGPKLTAFTAVLSFSGVLFMVVLGALFKNESIGLLEDLPSLGNVTFTSWEQRRDAISVLYSDNAINCWVAGGMYFVVFAASAVRFYKFTR